MLRIQPYTLIFCAVLSWSTAARGGWRQPPRVTIDPEDKINLTVTQTEMDARAAAILANYGSTPADKAALKDGILDVTKAPYLATPDNDSDDDWRAIQQAVYDAMQFKAVCFFPFGTYHVSRQISCPMPAIVADPREPTRGDIAASWFYRCVLVGDRSGERPVIALLPNRPDFQDPGRPKDVLHFWSVFISDAGANIDTGSEKPNSNFSHRLEYLKVDTGSGNPGATGVYMWGAQRCVIEDVEVEARDSFAGIRGIPGSGGMIRGIKVHGGRYGIYVVSRISPQLAVAERVFAGGQAGATIVGATLTGQLESNMFVESVTGPLTIAGGDFSLRQSPSSAPNFQIRGARAWLNLLDARIETGAARTAITTTGSVYLGNVYIGGAERAVVFPNHDERNLTAADDGWLHISEFSQSDESTHIAPHYLDGQNVDDAPLHEVAPSSTPPPDDLWTAHWPASPAMPYAGSAGVIDITQAPYLANGQDELDDWAALQTALNDAERSDRSVYVPRGTFYITRPLVLPPHVALFGQESSYSVIAAQDDARHHFQSRKHPQPMLDTRDDPLATASVAKLSFLAPVIAPPVRQFRGIYGVRWRYGRHSYVRDTQFRYAVERNPVVTAFLQGPYILITGGGGGRWYGLQRPNKWDGDEMSASYRTVKIDHTTEPLSFYMLNVTERTWDAPVSIEIDHASNVTIYSLKHENSETGSPGYFAQPLRATRANHLRLFGHSGNATQKPGDAMYELIDCRNVLLTHLARMSLAPNPADWSMLRDVYDGQATEVSGEKKLLFYKR